MDITIRLSDEQAALLKKRAKKNLFDLREMIEDIVRRSCINAKLNKSSSDKIDDNLVGIFSRQQRGRKKRSFEN